MARKDRLDRKHTGVTRVEEKRNVTTGHRRELRLTPIEKDQLSILTELVSEQLPNKRVTSNRVLRALCHIHDKSVVKRIAKSIQENT